MLSPLKSLRSENLLKRFIAVVVLAAGLIYLASAPVAGQMSSSPPLSTTGPPDRPRPGEGEPNPFPPDLQEKALKARNELRQKQLVSDTSKLLAAARELESEVGGSSGNRLPTSAMKRAEEVERLARSVKDKMRAE